MKYLITLLTAIAFCTLITSSVLASDFSYSNDNSIFAYNDEDLSDSIINEINYVDMTNDSDYLDGMDSTEFVAVAGDTMTGPLNIDSTAQSFIGGVSGLRFDSDDTGNTIYQVTSGRDFAITSNTGDIKFRPNPSGDYALLIDSDLNVGIGTTIPDVYLNSTYGKFVIANPDPEMIISDNSVQAFLGFQQKDNVAYITRDDGDSLVFGTKSSSVVSSINNQLVLDTTGTLNITTGKLAIGGKIIFSNDYLQVQNVGGAWLPIHTQGINIGDWNTQPSYGDVMVGNYNFDVLDDSGNSMFRLTNSDHGADFYGNVSIGSGNLEVFDGMLNIRSTANYHVDSDITGLILGPSNFNEDNGLAKAYRLRVENDGSYSDFHIDTFVGWNTTNPYEELPVNWTNRFTIDHNGYVGIGTTSPFRKLEVSSSNIRMSEGYLLEWGSGDLGVYGYQDEIGFRTNNNLNMLVDSDDNVNVTNILYAGTRVQTPYVTTDASVGYFNDYDGGTIALKSPDGTEFYCGVSNIGEWSCS